MVQTTVPSLLIIGTDTVLGASPATAVQLAHACLAAGYHAVIPASWGDELIAARALQRLNGADTPRVLCSCPLVSRRLSEHGDMLSAMLLHVVAPPVATAQYLRAAYAPVRPRITFAGACPSGIDDSIDVWLTPDALLRALVERGISVREQPTEFDSVIPPDRRRFLSDPGGVPSRQALQQLNAPVGFVELGGDDVVVALGQQLLGNSRVLIDVSVSLGCACSGRTASVLPEDARARVLEQEPPRAPSPVVDHSMPITLDGSTPAAVTNAASTFVAAAAPNVRPSEPIVSVAAEQSTSPVATFVAVAAPNVRPSEPIVSVAAAHGTSPVATPPAEPVQPRRTPTGQTRQMSAAPPIRRADAGRQLPRAFVTRRRSPPRGLRQSVYSGKSAALNNRGRWLWVAVTSLAVGIALALLLWRPA
ncbi:MAG TPA: hypothetical protein VFT29_12995 [Gemmatimonadaceae bacterium]|nr:hypothetical protein [Gemmatimonadaceae bacterium]